MKLKEKIIVALFAAILLLPTAALSQEEGSEEAEKKDKFLSFDLDGYYRLRWTRISSMDVYPGAPVERVRYWDQRWRLDPLLTIRPNLWILKSISLHTMADCYDGSFHIDHERPPNLYLDLRTWNQAYLAEDPDWKDDGFWLREYWGEVDLTMVVIRAGRMNSHWGRGILANEGDDSSNDFGDAYFGDMVERVLVATKPVDLVTFGRVSTDIYLAFAYDWLVIEDPTGDEDDDPEQYLIALFKEPEKETGNLLHDMMVGVYYVHRTQDDNTIANVVDLTFRLPFSTMDDALKLVLGFEGVYIWGETEANKSLNAPEGSDIRMYGFSASLAAETKRIDLITEVGLASGDPDPFDDEITDFHFNPDYNVGLLMFERVLAAATANTAYEFSSPALLSVPPAGIDLLPTNGAVTNAFYVYPRLKVRPVNGFELILGLLYAYAPEELMDPYQSFLNGGVATNFNGGPADSDLGWEFDMGVSYTLGDEEDVAVRFGAQWGWFWPGDAFDDAQGNSMDMVDLGQFRFDVLY